LYHRKRKTNEYLGAFTTSKSKRRTASEGEKPSSKKEESTLRETKKVGKEFARRDTRDPSREEPGPQVKERKQRRITFQKKF